MLKLTINVLTDNIALMLLLTDEKSKAPYFTAVTANPKVVYDGRTFGSTPG